MVNNSGVEMTKSPCTCLIRHAVTTDERAEMNRQLKYSREVGDTTGIMLAMMALTTLCPSAKE